MHKTYAFSTIRLAVFYVTLAAIGLGLTVVEAQGQGADWIWSPRHESEQVPVCDCYFRKKFTLINPDEAEISVVADDSFELFINGQQALTGSESDTIYEVDIASFLKPGVNLVAFKVENFHGNRAGLAARLRVKEKNETRWRSLKTDESWKTRIEEVASWKSNGYNDIGWLAARVFQADYLNRNNIAQSAAKSQVPASQVSTQVQSTIPPIKQANQLPPITQPGDVQSASTSSNRNADQETENSQVPSLTLAPEFKLQLVLPGEETGSIIAIAFNEFGNLIYSKEGGPLMIAKLALAADDPNRLQPLCEDVTSCQGILPINGDVYVTGDGPDGLALYRLGSNGDGRPMSIKSTVLKFQGQLGEHGPHGLELGPDGMIYCVVGNGSGLKGEAASTSPFRHDYEGDLVKRYEDPSGHASGYRGEGGTIIRTSLDGSKVEKVAGGIRNAYDLVFDPAGDLFIHDSDMESDIGMSWYRPTAISHVVPGAQLGWRSGWAKFPEYYVDSTPPASKTGRGSPTGAICYQHLQFPSRYHNAMFFADWSEGRILVANSRKQGTTAQLETEVFLSGKPLNVTDLAVGEDGAIYFSTGGRGTKGGVYRVFWSGKVPESMINFNSDLAKVIRHPQPNAAWARQNIAKLQKQLGATWKEDITGVVKETRNKAKFRTRALDIMVMYGPFPSVEFLTSIANDSEPQVRAKVAALCGLRPGYLPILNQLIADSDPLVRRHVCESMLRLGETPDAAALLNILQSSNRFETVAAQRLLAKIPAKEWFDKVLKSESKRVFIAGSLVAVSSEPTLERSYQILARCSEIMDGFVSDADFVDMLRLMQVTLVQGKVEPQNVPAFAQRIQREFPSGSGLLNRELAKILAYLKSGELNGRIAEYFEKTTDSNEDRVHVAMFLQTIGKGLSDPARIAVINQLEEARSYNNGGSYRLYLAKAIKEVADTISDNQVSTIIENGDRWPTAVISAYYRLPKDLTADQVSSVIELDKKLQAKDEDSAAKQARMGVIAVLAQCGDQTCMDYLRQLWKQESDRRGDIAIGLAQQPEGENWPYLVSSLPVLDDMTSVEVLTKLTEVDLRPKSANFYQHVLQLGYRLENEGAILSAKLLQHWSGEPAAENQGNWKSKLNHWKKWYEVKFPEGPSVEVPTMQRVGRYSVKQVSNTLEKSIGEGDAERGHLLFSKAQCANCHRFGSFGDSTGPDLTSIASRFSHRELIESVIDPSKVVSDQYRTQTILTQDGQQFTGMLVRESDGYTVLQSDGKKIEIADSEVDQIKQDKVSAMPEGLLDDLSPEEIRDLFAYMLSSNPERVADKNEEDSTTR